MKKQGAGKRHPAHQFKKLRCFLKANWITVTAVWMMLAIQPWMLLHASTGGREWFPFLARVLGIPLGLAILFAFIVLIAEESPPRSR
jgi:hypothetical protein